MSVFRPLNSDESNLFTIRFNFDAAATPTVNHPTSNLLPDSFAVAQAAAGIYTVTYGKSFTVAPSVAVVPSTSAGTAVHAHVAVRSVSKTSCQIITSAADGDAPAAGGDTVANLKLDVVIVGPVKIGLTTGNSNKGWQVEGGSSPADVYTYMNVGIGQGNPSGSFEVVDSNTTTNATSITADSLTTHDALVISADALTSGTALDVTSSSSGKTSGALVNVAQTGATTSQTAHTLAVSTSATTNSGAGAASFVADALTTGDVVSISADALTTGSAVDITSSSANKSSNALVNIAQTGTTTSQTGSTLSVSTSATTQGTIASFAGSALTTGNGVDISAAAMTTGTALDVGGLNALTTGKGALVSSAATAITGTGRLFSSVHSGNASTSGVLNEFSTAAADETVLARFTASAALAAGKVVDVVAGSMTTGTAVQIDGLDALTSGSGLVVNTNSANAASNLVHFHNEHADADSATVLLLTNAADGNSLQIAGGAMSCALNEASNITLTSNEAAEDLTIAVAGATDSSLILSSAGTGADALQISTSAGGMDITVAGAAAGEDLDITADSSIKITSSENVADAIVISASGSAAGMDFDCGTGDVDFCVSADARTTNLLTGNAIQTVNIASNDTPVNVITLGGSASTIGFFGATPVAQQVLAKLGAVDSSTSVTASNAVNISGTSFDPTGTDAITAYPTAADVNTAVNAAIDSVESNVQTAIRAAVDAAHDSVQAKLDALIQDLVDLGLLSLS